MTHVASVTDVLRQGSFPVYPAKRALVFVAVSLGLVFYLPARHRRCRSWRGPDSSRPTPASAFWSIATPTAARRPARASGSGCILPPPESRGPHGLWPSPAKRSNGPGKAGRSTARTDLLHSPGRLTSWPQACRFKIPPNQILVEPRDDGVSTVPIGPVVLVSPDRIIGRAWAQFYPVWDRRLL